MKKDKVVQCMHQRSQLDDNMKKRLNKRKEFQLPQLERGSYKALDGYTTTWADWLPNFFDLRTHKLSWKCKWWIQIYWSLILLGIWYDFLIKYEAWFCCIVKEEKLGNLYNQLWSSLAPWDVWWTTWWHARSYYDIDHGYMKNQEGQILLWCDVDRSWEVAMDLHKTN